MKTIGLLGGMSWQSTVTYYRALNEGVQKALGGLHSAEILLASIDFAPLEQMQAANDWDAAAELLANAAFRLQQAGAEALLICTNTMHKVAPQIQAGVDIPLLHIAEATGQELQKRQRGTVALLGTAFTREEDFYTQRLEDNFGLQVLIPDADQRKAIHTIIYDELCLGIIQDSSRQTYLQIIESLVERGAESIILGCTEIGLLVTQQDTPTELIDTTAVHAQSALDFMLA